MVGFQSYILLPVDVKKQVVYTIIEYYTIVQHPHVIRRATRGGYKICDFGTQKSDHFYQKTPKNVKKMREFELGPEKSILDPKKSKNGPQKVEFWTPKMTKKGGGPKHQKNGQKPQKMTKKGGGPNSRLPPISRFLAKSRKKSF